MGKPESNGRDLAVECLGSAGLLLSDREGLACGVAQPCCSHCCFRCPPWRSSICLARHRRTRVQARSLSKAAYAHRPNGTPERRSAPADLHVVLTSDRAIYSRLLYYLVAGEWAQRPISAALGTTGPAVRG